MKHIKWFFEKYPDTLFPFILLLLYIVIMSTLGSYVDSNIEAIMILVRGLYDIYGNPLVFLGGFLETLFMLGIYLPASLTIVLGVFVNPSSLSNLITVGLMCIFSAFLANNINYIIGKYGLVKFFNFLGANKVIQTLEGKKVSISYIVLSGFHPNLLGISVVYSAMKGMGYFSVMCASLISTVIWVPILVAFVAILGEGIFSSNIGYSFLAIFVIWILYIIVRDEIKRKFF